MHILSFFRAIWKNWWGFQFPNSNLSDDQKSIIPSVCRELQGSGIKVQRSGDVWVKGQNQQVESDHQGQQMLFVLFLETT